MYIKEVSSRYCSFGIKKEVFNNFWSHNIQECEHFVDQAEDVTLSLIACYIEASLNSRSA